MRLESNCQALAESLACLEPGYLRVYYSFFWGEEEFWRNILEEAPPEMVSCLMRAENLRKARRFKAALRELSKVSVAASSLSAALRAKVLLTMALSSGPRGLRRLGGVIKRESLLAMRDERCLWAYSFVQMVLCANGNQQQAYQMLKNLTRTHPDRAELYVNLLLQEFGGDAETCEIHLTHALELKPHWAALRAFRGELRRRMGRIDDSREDLDFAIKALPSFDRAYLWRSKVHRGRAAAAKASWDVERALELEPLYARAHFERAQLFLQAERPAAALKSLDRAIDLESSYPWNHAKPEILNFWRYQCFTLLRRLRQYGKALDCLLRLRRDAPTYVWDQDGKRNALSQLDDAVAQYPREPWFRGWRGHARMSVGDWVEAKIDLDWAVRCAPRQAWFRLWRAEAALRMGCLDSCLRDLRQAARSKACRGRACGLRAEVALKNAAWMQALGHARQAAKLVPTGSWALVSWARALLGLGRKRQARSVLQRAWHLAPGDADVLSLIAGLDGNDSFFPFDLRRIDAAAFSGSLSFDRRATQRLYARYSRSLRAEIRLASKASLARIHAQRGWVSFRAGKYQRAIIDLDQAVALDPHNPVYHLWRGLAHRGIGEWAKALMDFSASIERQPDAAVAYFERAGICRKLGDFRGALADAKSLARLKPFEPAGRELALELLRELRSQRGHP